MNAPPSSHIDWNSFNQNVLVAEFARLKGLLRGEETTAVASLEEAYGKSDVPAAIDRLVESFGLTGFERDLLLLAAGVEADSEMADLCAATGSHGQHPLTFGLALAVLSAPHWSALAPTRPLRRWRLIETGNEGLLSSCRLTIDERVLHYLIGLGYLDLRLQPLFRVVEQTETIARQQRGISEEITAVIERSGSPLPLLQLWGSDIDGKHDVAAEAAARLGLQLHVVDVADLPAAPQELEALVGLWQREAALLNSALLVDGHAVAPSTAVRRFIERLGGVTFIAAEEPVDGVKPDYHFRVERPGYRDQLNLWQEMLGERGQQDCEAVEGVSREFRFSRMEIERVAGRLDFINGDERGGDTLWSECQHQQGRRFDNLAERIEPVAGWDDLVLAENQKKILAQIAVQFRQRRTVYDDWGFAGRSTRGLGISALFAGESGTGKTMAAEVLANRLHLELYRIDLSAVVSKYIGETEKNLARVFDAAEDSGVILLFDEADALFGKRSEVKDSHDRYANIEVSYLLQRMEAFRGLAILTTNQKTALDTAFQRRLRFVVNFPFPDSAEREAIWRGIFPSATPLENLAYEKLSRLQMAGGSIRNIALNAAFIAADSGGSVTMEHILRAAHAEADKRERPLGDAETRGWGCSG